MGEQSPVIEGHVKFREGKKVRFIDTIRSRSIIKTHLFRVANVRQFSA